MFKPNALQYWKTVYHMISKAMTTTGAFRSHPRQTFSMTIVTKFGYLLYWDITGAPRHIPGQALFCVNIGNGWNCVCNNCFNYSNLYWVKLWVIWINSDFEFKYIRLIIRYWFCSTIHYLGDDIYSRARLQVLATGWVSPTVGRQRSLEGKTHVDKYEQYQSFSVNYTVLSF